MGILEEYKLQLEKDRETEDKMFPEGSQLTENKRKEYEKRLEEIRNSTDDMENAYRKKMAEMKHMSEDEMEQKNLLKEEEIDKIVVKHAYCTECGEELISKTPALFNPFTLERVCKHICTKCGTIFNLEYAYPRIAFLNNKGEEIPAFTC